MTTATPPDAGLRADPGPEEVALPRLGPGGWARWAWRQLTGMRTALVLLLLLAVAAVPGSVFPQRRVDPARVQQYLAEHRGSGPWLDRLGLFDVYASPWFAAVYLLLFVSLIGCVLPRARQHARALRSAPPRTPRRLDRLPVHARAEAAGSPAEVLARAEAELRRRRYRVVRHEEGASLAAERGYLAETGNLAFHLALLGLLGAIAAGSVTTWSGQAIVVEQDSFADVLPAYDSFSAGSRVDTDRLPPFALTLRRLRVGFEEQPGSQHGAPRDFTATVEVTDRPGAAARIAELKVNRPLEVAGARVYLAGNGYAPVIKVTDGAGRVAFRGAVPFLPQDGAYTSVGVVKAPDAVPRQLGLTGLLLPTAVFDPVAGPISIFPDADRPRLVLTAFVAGPGRDGLGLNSGVPQSVYRLDTSRLTQLRDASGQPARLLLAPGGSAELPDGAGRVTFEGLRRYVALDVRHDPTQGWVLGFALLALAGVTTSLFVRRRRLWLRPTVGEDGSVTVVEVAGLARGDDPGLEPVVHELLAAVSAGRPQPQHVSQRQG